MAPTHEPPTARDGRSGAADARMSGFSGYSLRQPLPAEVIVGGSAAWSRYRQYPVFSAPWLGRRSLLFMALIAPAAVLLGAVAVAEGHGYRAGLLMFALQFTGFSLMATAGPAFATWVRHRRWSEARERRGVVVAVLLGVVSSFVVDHFVSAEVTRLVALETPAPGGRAGLGPVARVVALSINIAVLLLVYGLFGGGLALRAYFSERRRWTGHRHRQELEDAQRRARDADLRLGVLQAQVEPHFLFNTLASVRALVRQEPAQAEAMLDALAGFLRATIPRLREDSVALHSTLGQQLDLCTTYLALMQLRMGGRLQYGVQADASLRAHPFPPALLITLVENAIRHGLESRPGGGCIDIVAVQREDRLQVEVIDDGTGLKPGPVGGVGLANVREQLAQRFGGRARLRLHSRDGRGVVAGIEVPWEDRA